MDQDNFVKVSEGDIHILVLRGTSWDEIEKRLEDERLHQKRRWLQQHYAETHYPIDEATARCLGCNMTLMTIHARKLICKPHYKESHGA